MKSLILRFAASRFVILLQRHRQDWFHNSLKCIFSSKDFNCAKLEIRRKILAVELVIDDQRQRNIWILDLSPKKLTILSILLGIWINQVPDTNTNQSIKYQSESTRPYPPYISREENSQLLYSLTLTMHTCMYQTWNKYLSLSLASKSLKPYFSVPVKKTVLLSVSYVGLTRADSWKHDVGNRSSVK